MMNLGIYNNRLFNTPAPVGYGVTIPQDLRPYFAMGDRFYTTNFGMETQFNLFDGGYNPVAYHLAQNPQLAFTNPMLLGYNLDGMGSSPSIEAMPSVGASTMANIAKQRIAQQAPQALAALEKNLQEALNNDKLTDEQKSRIQAKLDELKALKEEFQQVLANQNATADEVYAVESKLAQLRQDISQLGQTLAEEVQASTNSGSADETGAATDSNGVIDRPKIPESVLETHCQNIDACIDGAGTDEDNLFLELQKINKDNVIEIIGHWEATRGTHAENEGMLDKMLRDLNDGEQKQMVPLIRDALVQRAEELGIYDEIKENVAAVNKELLNERKWYYIGWFYGGQDDDTIKNNLMEIYDKIVAKEANGAAEAKQKAETEKAEEAEKKAETERKEAAKADEAKALFLNDMREILKDENAEISDKVEYADGKFKIRIEGRNFYGSDYVELAAQIKKAGYEPEQYLKKQQLQVAA